MRPETKAKLAALVVFVLIIVIIVARAMKVRNSDPLKLSKRENYLIFPYYDLENDSLDGNPYALSEGCPVGRTKKIGTEKFFGAPYRPEWMSKPPGPEIPYKDLDRNPYNIQRFDYPFQFPHYSARKTDVWDDGRHCSTTCDNSECTIWCR